MLPKRPTRLYLLRAVWARPKAVGCSRYSDTRPWRSGFLILPVDATGPGHKPKTE